jgi:hypothetical protein
MFFLSNLKTQIYPWYPPVALSFFSPPQPLPTRAVHSTQCRYGRSIVAPYFSFIRKGRYIRPEGTALNAIDKGKSFSRIRNSLLFEDIAFLVDRPESCVNLRAQGELLKSGLKPCKSQGPRRGH